MKRFLIFLLGLCLPFLTYGEEHSIPRKAKASPVYNYTPSSHVSSEVWELVKPYLLPSNHPIKPKLDKIFGSQRVTQNSSTVLAAGFPRFQTRPFSLATVSKHPSLKGYLVKMYTDDLAEPIDYLQWINRIEGAKCIQASIEAHGYENLFKVPKKWIYPLPDEPSPPEDHFRKNFILIVEDMEIYHRDHNYNKWRSDRMTKKRAEAIFTMIQENGLHDCVYPFNIPFCHDGKQAFIDTEHHHRWPVPLDKALRFLSPKIAQHWYEMIHNGGPTKKK